MKKSSIVFCIAAAVMIFGAAAPAPGQSIVLQWDQAELNAIVATATAPTVAARALAVISTAMYDAWAAYDPVAVGTPPSDGPRQPASAATTANKAEAISYAAYITCVDLFRPQKAAFDALMTSLGYDPTVYSTDPNTPQGIGVLAATQVLILRHADGSNQLGDLGGTGPYTDYTGYTAINLPETLTDPNRWQPLRLANGTVQKFLSPQWGLVTPFALTSGNQFRPGPQPQSGTWLYDERMSQVIALNAGLTDRDKVDSEFWNDAPGSVTPPGHWNEFAQDISNRDKHTIDDDVKMFFAMNNALMDASIAIWEAKRYYDAIRPISAVRYWYATTTVTGWDGPGNGIVPIMGSMWTPWIPTPAHPEYPSGHSGFSAAAGDVLRKFTGGDTYVKNLAFAPGSSVIDPGHSPAQAVTLSWLTFTEVADDAGYSRRAGGIHYDEADYRSRIIGHEVSNAVWNHYQALLAGTP